MRPTSFSQNNMFSKCARHWYYAYVKKIPAIQDMSYANAGTVVHKIMQNYYNWADNSIEAMKKEFKVLWEKYKLHQGMLKNRSDEYWLMVVNGINTKQNVTSNELRIIYPDVVAYLDFVDTSNDIIGDWKSSKRRLENEEEYTKQVKFYSYLYRLKFSRLPKKAIVYYLRYVGTKGTLEYIPTIEDIMKIEQWHFNIRRKMEEIITKGKLPPKVEVCNPWCPYKGLCKGDDSDNIKFKLNIVGNYIQIQGLIAPILNVQLHKKFSYELKNAYFIKKNNPHARTTIDFWSETRKLLPIGFKEGLLKTLKDYGEYKKKELVLDFEDTRTFDDTKIKMPDKFVNGKELRDYQSEAVDEYIRKKIAMIEAATGSGKTLMACEMIRQLGIKTLIMVNRIELLNQWKEVLIGALGIKVGQIGGGVDDIQHITIGTIQTIYKNIKKYSPYLKTVRFSIMDECVNKDTKILLTDGTEKCIDEVYNDKNITCVISYNENKKIFESKKILRKIKQPMKESWYHLIIKDELDVIHKLLVTGNHKVWTEKGYKQVSELNNNDILKVNLSLIKYKCDICGRIYDSLGKMISCKVNDLHPNLHSENGMKNAIALAKKRADDKEYDKKFRNSIKKGIKEIREKNPEFWKNMKIMGIKRRGKNNPVFRHPGTIDKIRKTQKEKFHKMSIDEQKKQIKRWNSSYRIMPKITKPEKIIIDMNISNLEHNENKKYMFKFKNNKWKIPDFKVTNEKKVIEVSDFEHWRTIEEADSIVESYKKIGVKCLYLDKLDLYNDYEKTKKRIEKFCYNHKAFVVSVRRARANPHKNKENYRYNLEIEDNHNYFANKILVSNCHNVNNLSYWRTSLHLLNTEYRLGLSGTPRRSDGNDMYLYAVNGQICFSLNADKLIKKGWLMKPIIKFVKDFMDKDEVKRLEDSTKEGLINETEKFNAIYKAFILNNEKRNSLIKDITDKNKGKKILVLVKLVEHGERLAKSLDTVYLFGSTPKKEREKIMEEFKKGDLNVLVGTLSIFSEGLDIPVLRVLINASGQKSDIKSVQTLGRLLRKHEGKDNCIYYDFIDESRYMKSASFSRLNSFKKEGHTVEYVDKL